MISTPILSNCPAKALFLWGDVMDKHLRRKYLRNKRNWKTREEYWGLVSFDEVKRWARQLEGRPRKARLLERLNQYISDREPRTYDDGYRDNQDILGIGR